MFFSYDDIAVQIPVSKRKSITGRYYRDDILKQLKKNYSKHCTVSGFRHVRLLYIYAPSHTAELVKQFLKLEKFTVLPHQPYSPDPAPCDFFLFPILKNFLSRRRSTQPLVSASQVYLNRRTAENTLKGCTFHFTL